MRFFLRIKAWQLFLLIFVVPGGLSFFLECMAARGRPMAGSRISETFVILIILTPLLCWLWTLGTQLNKKVPEEMRTKSRFFRFGIVYLAICAICSPVFSELYVAPPLIGILTIPLWLSPTFCLFYGFYFVSKNLVMAEQKQTVKFSKFAESFFMIWFYPWGIWFIQPRVNKMFQNELDT